MPGKSVNSTATGPSLSTIKKLFARSLNQCAFPDCMLPIVEESDTITGHVCHIKARSKGGPRYDSKQPNEERHALDNLILLCVRHSKLIDSEPQRYTVEYLREMKRYHEEAGIVELSQIEAKKAVALFTDYESLHINAGGHVMVNSSNSVQATNVTFKTGRTSVRLNPPDGSLGADLSKRNYIAHLVSRYQEFAKQQKDRDFRYQAIHAEIKKRFGAKLDHIPVIRFDELAEFLKRRVDGTRIGKIRRSKGQDNYSTFDSYVDKHERPRHP